MVGMVHVECYRCHSRIYMEQRTLDRLRESKQLFWCLNGHDQKFTRSASEIEIDRLKRDLDLIGKARARAEAEAEEARQRLTERDRTCPKCNRVLATVAGLKQHTRLLHGKTKRLPAEAGPDAVGTNITRLYP